MIFMSKSVGIGIQHTYSVANGPKFMGLYVPVTAILDFL